MLDRSGEMNDCVHGTYTLHKISDSSSCKAREEDFALIRDGDRVIMTYSKLAGEVRRAVGKNGR